MGKRLIGGLFGYLGLEVILGMILWSMMDAFTPIWCVWLFDIVFGFLSGRSLIWMFTVVRTQSFQINDRRDTEFSMSWLFSRFAICTAIGLLVVAPHLLIQYVIFYFLVTLFIIALNSRLFDFLIRLSPLSFGL